MAKKSANSGKPQKKRPGKGGVRKGSGRKPIHDGGTEKFGIRVPMDVANWIESSGLGPSGAITHAVRTCPDYLAFSQRDQQKQ